MRLGIREKNRLLLLRGGKGDEKNREMKCWLTAKQTAMHPPFLVYSTKHKIRMTLSGSHVQERTVIWSHGSGNRASATSKPQLAREEPTPNQTARHRAQCAPSSDLPRRRSASNPSSTCLWRHPTFCPTTMTLLPPRMDHQPLNSPPACSCASSLAYLTGSSRRRIETIN